MVRKETKSPDDEDAKLYRNILVEEVTITMEEARKITMENSVKKWWKISKYQGIESYRIQRHSNI